MTDTPKTDAQSFSFKAETKQLLNILIHSLYKDQEVFLRELLSNASDALNRAHFEMLTNQNMLDADVELNIRITADKDKRMLTIQDTGIGMTKDEIIENLGTIAQSIWFEIWIDDHAGAADVLRNSCDYHRIPRARSRSSICSRGTG